MWIPPPSLKIMKNKQAFTATMPHGISGTRFPIFSIHFHQSCPYTENWAPRTGEGLAALAADIESCLIPLPRKSCWAALGPDLALPLPCYVTAGRVFEFSFFSPLNWDDKIDLTAVVRSEPSSVCKHWLSAEPMSRCSIHHGCCYSLLLFDC